MRNHTEHEPATAAELEAELARGRDLAEARRADELERKRAEARHARDLADVAEQSRLAEMDRAEREAQAEADADLARMYRKARAAGERTRVSSQMARSGEARALRLERLRTLNLRVLVPVLIGFAAWSTTGVHDGAARLMQVTDHAPTWWALWVLEPVLIGAVVWVIVARARLASSGGRIDARAVSLAAGCLTVSVTLNLAAGAHAPARWSVAAVCALAASMLAHAIGPVGAAATAHLIGIVDESVAAADPWTQDGRPVPLLADMDLGRLTTPTEEPQQPEAGRPLDIPPAMRAALIESLIADGLRTAEETERDLFTDEALAAWIDGGEPPATGLMSADPTPDTGGPHSAAQDVPVTPDHIESDQQRRDDRTPAVPGITSAAEARRAAGEQTRARIAAYMRQHPNATIGEIADALDLHPSTIKRHRRAIQPGER